MTIRYFDGNLMIRDSTIIDAIEMAPNIRKEEIEEIHASDSMTPLEALMFGYNNSQACYTAVYKGKPIAMFGHLPLSLIGKKSVVWMLTTPDVLKIKKKFMILSKKIINYLLEMYPYLTNYVDARYSQSIRWLKWCGAEIGKAEKYGPYGYPFHPFLFKRS